MKVVTLNSLKLFLDYLKKNFKAPFAERDGDGNIIKDTYLHATDKIDFAKKADVSDSCTGKSASAGKAEQLSEAREVRLTGGVSGAGMFDGSGDLVIETTIGDVTEGINELRSETDTKISTLRTDTDTQISTLSTDTAGKIDALRTETNTKVSDLDTKISGLDTKLDDTKKELAASQETEISKTNAVISTNDVAASPCYYSEDTRWKADGRTTLKSPNILWMNVNNLGYRMSEAVSLPVNEASSWDSTETDYTTGASRAGKDFYIFACIDSDRNLLFKLSANSTVPAGYTSENSRKVGGFHCLCVDAGTNISDNNNVHPLSGYVAGDVLPAAVWDLKHRPKCDPEGMAYDEGTDMWYSIYLLSYTGAYSTDNLQLVSKYGGVIADGKSTEAFHPAKFEQVLATEKMRLPYQREFVAYSIGSNQATTIKGATDPTTTGGHVDSKGRRMISNIGLEDCCGVMWQYGADKYGVYTSGDYTNRYDSNDRYVYGKLGHKDYYAAMGGGYGFGGAVCGSRAAYWGDSSLTLAAGLGARGASEPLGA